MDDRRLHLLFGFIGGSVGLVIAITGTMFWLDPPPAALPGWGLALLIIGGAATLAAGVAVARGLAAGRLAMIGLGGCGLLAALAGVVRAALAGNWAAVVIVATAFMPLVLIIAVMIELGRAETS